VAGVLVDRYSCVEINLSSGKNQNVRSGKLGFHMKKSSIRNQLAGKVQQIVRGPVVSEVVVSTAAGTLASVITTRSVQDLKLKKGDAVFVMIKATEASIQKGDS
jgi:molybdopterin-binding protein